MPSDAAGTVKEVKVKAGDKVSQGTVIALVETAEAGAAAALRRPDAPKKAPAANANASAKPAAGGGTQEVKVPDIGDFSDIPVIEIHVKPGDTVEKEQSLVTLESDKATMDVPSPAAGTVKELKVKVGDNVSEGVVILTLEGAGGGAAAAEPSRSKPRRKPPLRRPRLRPRPRRAASPAPRISNATCSCSARAPAVIRPRSAPPTSA